MRGGTKRGLKMAFLSPPWSPACYQCLMKSFSSSLKTMLSNFNAAKNSISTLTECMILQAKIGPDRKKSQRTWVRGKVNGFLKQKTSLQLLKLNIHFLNWKVLTILPRKVLKSYISFLITRIPSNHWQITSFCLPTRRYLLWSRNRLTSITKCKT